MDPLILHPPRFTSTFQYQCLPERVHLIFVVGIRSLELSREVIILRNDFLRSTYIGYTSFDVFRSNEEGVLQNALVGNVRIIEFGVVILAICFSSIYKTFLYNPLHCYRGALLHSFSAVFLECRKVLGVAARE